MKFPTLLVARMSYQLPTTAGDATRPTGFSHFSVLDVLSSTTPRPLGRKPRWARHLANLATKAGTTCGLALLLIIGCGTTSEPTASDPGTRVIHRNAVLHEGPELVAAVAYRQGRFSVAEEWLILAVELTSPRGSGPTILTRRDISVLTPDGHRLELISQDEFVRRFARFGIPVERALAYLPLLYRFIPNRMPSDRWFFAISAEDIGFDEIPLNSSQTNSGPLVFSVPGGVQPGRWRLVIELEESRPNIPFVIEIKN